MKLCQVHWGKVREAINSRGMGSLVSKDGAVAIDRLEDELKGTATPESYDPLMSVNNMIFGRALEFGGLYLMTGDFCPICEAIKHRAGVVDPEKGRPYTTEEEESYWIDGPADGALTYCREKGLMPQVQ